MMVKEVVSYLENVVMIIEKTVHHIGIGQQADSPMPIDRKSEMNSLEDDQDWEKLGSQCSTT